jgi:hypothetical protein
LDSSAWSGARSERLLRAILSWILPAKNSSFQTKQKPDVLIAHQDAAGGPKRDLPAAEQRGYQTNNGAPETSQRPAHLLSITTA